MKKFRFLAACLIIAASMLSFACVGRGGRGGGIYTLKVWAPAEEQTLLMDMRDDFLEENPELAETIKFDFEILGMNDVVSQIISDSASAAKIFRFPAGAINELGGNLLPVTYRESVGRIEAEHSEAALNSVRRTSDGTERLMAVPVSPNNFVLHYNKSIFTADDVTSIERMLSKDTGVEYNLAMPLSDGWYTKAFFLTAGATLYGPDGDDPAVSTFNGADGLAAAQYLMDLAVHDKFLNDSGGIGGSEFREGNLGAFFGPPISSKDVIASADVDSAVTAENYASAPLPKINISGEDRQMRDFAEYQAYGLNTSIGQGRGEEESIEIILAATLFVEYITNANAQMRRFEVTAAAPTIPSILGHPAIQANPAVAASLAQADINTIAFPLTPQISDFWEPMRTFGGDIAGRAESGNGSYSAQQLQQRLNDLVQGITRA